MEGNAQFLVEFCLEAKLFVEGGGMVVLAPLKRWGLFAFSCL